jgi:UDP-N-acetylmuramyl pentapeptide phosphotransferase/UDP-N-acetylglucosamine-1-phosphate transferase
MPPVLPMFLAFVCSVTVTMLLVRSASMHARHSGDRDFSKPQKFHAVAVPRIGGIGLVLGIACGIGALAWQGDGSSSGAALLLLACGLPAFVVGLVQDFTDSLTPRGRLLATAVSAVLAGAAVTETAIPGIDWLVGFAAGSLAVTVLAVTGIANAINIIDGFNGLASMCAVLMLAAVSYVGYQVGDPLVGVLALAGIGAVLGFFLWNFPAGLIFLGDGGAYFLGFFLAELCILLVNRNPGEVSPLFPLLVCIYPVFETVFSIYRRVFLRSAPASMPDGIHLHSLVYRRVLRWAVGDRSAKALARRNSMTSPYLWLLCTLSVGPAALFWNNTGALTVCLLVFVISYVALYWRIVRFRSPRWLRFRPSRARPLAAGDRRGG